MTGLRECAVSPAIDLQQIQGCRLWIDGVGTWLVWFGKTLRIGNAAPTSGEKWRIQGDLRTVHARIQREDGDYRLEADGPARCDGIPVSTSTILPLDSRVELGADVELRFDVPSPLSGSAVVQLVGGHRAADGSAGVVLFDQTCLLGRGKQVHILCRGWDATVILFERQGQLWWRQHGLSGPGCPVGEGEFLSGEDWSFRVETVK